MNIDLEQYILSDIGHTDWDVETNRCKNNKESREKVEKALNIKVED